MSSFFLQTTVEDLQQSLSVVMPGIDGRNALPILSCVLFRKSDGITTLTSSDLTTEISHSSDLGGDPAALADESMCLSAHTLSSLLKTLPPSSGLTLGKHPKHSRALELRCGKSRFTLQTLPGEDLPLMVAGEWDATLSVDKPTLQRMLETTSYAMASHDIRYYLMATLFDLKDDSLTLVGSDGHRMAITRTSFPGNHNIKILVPRRSALTLAKMLGSRNSTDITVQINRNQARFTMGETVFTTSLVEGQYPQYERVIPKTSAHTATVSRGVLLSAIKATRCILTGKVQGMSVTFTRDKMTLVALNDDEEESHIEIAAQYQGSTIRVGMNSRYLLEAVDNLASDEVAWRLTDDVSASLIQNPDDPDTHVVLMPMRL